MIRAYFIGIGNEILQGKIQDLNLKWLASFLFHHNIELTGSQFIRDDSHEIGSALKLGLEKAELIVTSGGLGPTKDDLTKEAVSQFFNLNLKDSDQALKIAQENFQSKHRVYDPETKYHSIPEGFIPLPNKTGFAPGLYFRKQEKRVFVLPGVPSEFQSILESSFSTLMPKSTQIQKNLVFRTWKLHESKIFKEVDSNLWEHLSQHGQVSSLPHQVGVDIGVTILADSKEEIFSKEKTIAEIIGQSPVSSYIWNRKLQSIEELILEMFSNAEKTLATAESCTGGLIAHTLTNLSGSSAFFQGSAVTYAIENKISQLGVSEKTIQDQGVVSIQTVKEMAQGAQREFKTDFAVSTSGVAGPSGGTEEIPVGTVAIGIATPSGVHGEIVKLRGSRLNLKTKFSEYALHLLRESFLNFYRGIDGNS